MMTFSNIRRPFACAPAEISPYRIIGRRTTGDLRLTHFAQAGKTGLVIITTMQRAAYYCRALLVTIFAAELSNTNPAQSSTGLRERNIPTNLDTTAYLQ